MTEDMSRAKARVLKAHPKAEFIGHSAGFMGRIVVRDGMKLKELCGWVDGEQEDAWIRAESRLPAELKDDPVGEQRRCNVCGQMLDNGWKHAQKMGYGDFESVGCSVPDNSKEDEGGGVEQPMKCLNCDKLRSQHWERNDGFYCHTDGEELFRSEWKPKEVAPKEAAQRCKHCGLVIEKSSTYKITRAWIHEHSGVTMCDRITTYAEPATEGAPETDPCKMTDAQYEEYLYGPDRAKWTTNEAQGEEKATEMKRPEYQWARLLSDNTQNHSVYLTEAADAYMDALESRNAELQKECLKIRINHLPPAHWTENDEWKRHPQSSDEWNWHNDNYQYCGKRSELRLNFAADLEDPHAPDQMAVVLRIDLLRVMARMQSAEAYKKSHMQRCSSVIQSRDERQRQAHGWMVEAFGSEQSDSIPHRAIRFFEESAEATQAAGVDKAMAHKMVDYVWSRPKGELSQELGGVGLTILGLAKAAGLSADEEEARELTRVLSKPLEHFRKRNDVKIEDGFIAVDSGE